MAFQRVAFVVGAVDVKDVDMGVLLVKEVPQLLFGDLPFATLAVDVVEELALLKGVGHQLGIRLLAAAFVFIGRAEIVPVVFDIAVDIALFLFGEGKAVFSKFGLNREIFLREVVHLLLDPGQSVDRTDLLVVEGLGGVDIGLGVAAVVGADRHPDVHPRGHFISPVLGAVGPGRILIAGRKRQRDHKRRHGGGHLHLAFQAFHSFLSGRFLVLPGNGESVKKILGCAVFIRYTRERLKISVLPDYSLKRGGY